MSVRSLRTLDLIVFLLERLANGEQPTMSRCQLHQYVLQAIDDEDIYGDVKKSLEELERSFRLFIPIDYRKMADDISRYL